jgi:serine/threonine protein kinase
MAVSLIEGKQPYDRPESPKRANAIARSFPQSIIPALTPLPPGTKLGPYEISSSLGAGAMGEVHRAKDTRLGRDVAIKVLPGALAQNTDRLQRFEHEARVLGTMNHPNLLAIFDVGSQDDLQYLVLTSP